jgi:simple sugar transport system ATP-binding protein
LSPPNARIDGPDANPHTAAMTAAQTPAAVELRGLTKHFGAVAANDGVNLRIEPGTIHGIIGENGAGKSTAMKMVYGMFRPDAGQILIHGQPRVWNSPSDAIAAGIGMVHQHFMLAGPYSAIDNIVLADEPRRFGIVIDRRKAQRRLEQLSQQYGLSVEWRRPVEDLPVGVQQRIEILKLLYRDAHILILDEPTAVLTPQETNALFANLRKLSDQGKTIILITHKLREVMGFTQRITVMRNGKVTGQVETASTSPAELATLMVGRKVTLDIHVPTAQPRDAPAIEVHGLSLAGAQTGSRHKLTDVSFTVRRGEIVGVAGVEGNGQSELIEAILHPADPRCRTAGVVKILGRDVAAWHGSKIRDLSVGFIPEDRQHQGLLVERSLRENFLLGRQRECQFSRAGFLRRRRIAATATRALEQFDVRPRDLWRRARDLSGGNQQKLIIAREFQFEPSALIAAQPTRGVDVGAIEFIHTQIVRARDRGAGLLLISSELDEILTLSDRILVMYEGRIVAEFRRGAVSERELGLKMGGS